MIRKKNSGGGVSSSAQIADATPAGRAMLTAADEAAQRALLEAETVAGATTKATAAQAAAIAAAATDATAKANTAQTAAITASTSLAHTVIAGTSDALSAANSGLNRQRSYTSASAVTVTIPAGIAYDANAALCWILRQRGTGKVTLSPAGGATIAGTNTATAGQHTSIILIQTGLNTYETEGGGVP